MPCLAVRLVLPEELLPVCLTCSWMPMSMLMGCG